MPTSTPNGATLRRVACSHPLVERVYQTYSVPQSDGAWGPMDVYIPQPEGDYLYSLVHHLRPDLKGRCVVLKKLGRDDRDGQTRFHRPF
jgi:hypothetical protein